MGIDWMLIRPARKKFLLLPKRSEWCNDLWKIWEIIQSLESGEPFVFINDGAKEFEEILNNPEWNAIELSDEEDPEGLLYLVENIAVGGSVAIYHALRMMEKRERK